MITGDHS
jgi:xylan 1,4-beta-xylosidase